MINTQLVFLAVMPVQALDLTPERLNTTVLTARSPSFLISAANRSYKHQYANIYFVRLKILREFIEEKASKLWSHLTGNPVLIPRVLEVIKSQLCYVIGTIYMDMPLKPNVLEDIARDRSIPPPVPTSKFYSQEDNVMLEDESGRIRLVGERIKAAKLVTGVIIGALGVETPTGDFEVVDICYADMAPQKNANVPDKDKMDIDDKGVADPSDAWIALVSGLDVGAPSSSDAQIQMLVEYLTGEEGGVEEQMSAAQISRLIIAGNSLSQILIPVKGEGEIDKKPRRYGYDSTTFSPYPTLSLSAHLLDLSRVMPIHILPGEADPSGTLLPQQPFPRALFGAVASFPTVTCETNPTYLRIASGSESDGSNPTHSSITRTLLIHSGQPLNDMYKYLSSPPTTRLSLLESTLRWRHMAPTAPDTLWCHPYFSSDPFLIEETPDLYIAGNQPKFGTRLVVENGDEGKRRCRIVLVPAFAKTGFLVLVNLRTLDVKTVEFGVQGMSSGVMRSQGDGAV